MVAPIRRLLFTQAIEQRAGEAAGVRACVVCACIMDAGVVAPGIPQPGIVGPGVVQAGIGVRPGGSAAADCSCGHRDGDEEAAQRARSGHGYRRARASISSAKRRHILERSGRTASLLSRVNAAATSRSVLSERYNLIESVLSCARYFWAG